MNAIVAALEKCVPNMNLRPRDASSPCPVTRPGRNGKGPVPLSGETICPQTGLQYLRMKRLFLAGMVMAASLFGASNVYDFSLKSIDGAVAPLSAYKGKV